LKRKHFINKCLKAAAASLLLPSVINKSDTLAKANPQAPSFRPRPDKWKDDEINIAWIGHATVLINFYGTWILTDPVLFETIGIYILGTNWGPNRFTHPALTIDEIPKPDIILLSHAHMDHMDYATLSEITNNFVLRRTIRWMLYLILTGNLYRKLIGEKRLNSLELNLKRWK
jgi:hypothetical protein